MLDYGNGKIEQERLCYLSCYLVFSQHRKIALMKEKIRKTHDEERLQVRYWRKCSEFYFQVGKC